MRFSLINHPLLGFPMVFLWFGVPPGKRLKGTNIPKISEAATTPPHRSTWDAPARCTATSAAHAAQAWHSPAEEGWLWSSTEFSHSHWWFLSGFPILLFDCKKWAHQMWLGIVSLIVFKIPLSLHCTGWFLSGFPVLGWWKNPEDTVSIWGGVHSHARYLEMDGLFHGKSI